MSLETNQARWKQHLVLAHTLRVVAFLIPIVAAIATSLALAYAVPGAAQHGPAWWTLILVVPTVAAAGTNRMARRLLPLTALCKLSLIFPDQAPSRMKIALRSGTVRQLEAHIDRVKHDGLGGEATQAAEYLLELVGALNIHDRRTRGHAERVRAFADLLADEMKLSDDDRDRLHWAALLHDIGKIAVPHEILNKPGAPDEAEWEILKQHPIEGEKLAAPLSGWLGEWALAIGQHHERWDGKGYPRGLSGADLSLAARIVGVADSFEVMTATRSYKRPISATAARAELARCAGSQFDPAVVRAFLDISIGRLRWMLGPMSLLAQIPVVPQVREAVQQVAMSATRTAGIAAASTAMAVTSLAATGHLTTAADAQPDPTPAASVAPAPPPAPTPLPIVTTTTTTLPPTTTTSTTAAPRVVVSTTTVPLRAPTTSVPVTSAPTTAVTTTVATTTTTTTVAVVPGPSAAPTTTTTACPLKKDGKPDCKPPPK